MPALPSLSLVPLQMPRTGTLVVLAGADAATAASLPEAVRSHVARAGSAYKFKGKSLAVMDLLAPEGIGPDRILVIGLDADKPLAEEDWLKLGGAVAGRVKGAGAVTVWLDRAAGSVGAAEAAWFAQGLQMRSYSFDAYKSVKSEDESDAQADSVSLALADPEAARGHLATAAAVADGVALARDLVNEPANVLGPVEFADRLTELSKQGVEVEVLTEAEMRALGMNALLGVAQGSPRPPRLVVMRWNGAEGDAAPVAFIGKGVVFDTGGVSIKPAAGMEDMKGDMGGAAAVSGLMLALAGRKAKVNAIGIVGLVENAVDGNAQRPGDIVKAMSGTTIEVNNTDAEGRLVLADALWYCQDRFKPRFMINLATLTGAIIVALGNHHAGLFSNDDELSERLAAAGRVTGEKVWRMPLGPEYDKLIEGKFADIKNVGAGRAAGSITAAQFLQRFVNTVAWAHLDIAGTAMGSPANEYNQSWGSGFGVRLLDRLVTDHYETR
ncbi:leucyl aminopeptidase [Mangrovibrevibacter kandeliae]|uniref:leucyl aminopeptidase n=1 Tax=Mangrovibrevibacter kandeliae TaxID=2968473 RepID=UPI002117B7E9|nr:leucyl aminopeptidase [Aurantimonas sp. CSK15Z-1]MCQ8781385.1 leucyl aminopeptidase [Aurantimonas sp. CSK15Z-1]